jgi:glutathione S-transferase
VRVGVADVDREQHGRIIRDRRSGARAAIVDMFRPVDAKLYVIPGSHPSRTAMSMLERKGIAYKRVDLLPVISKGVLRAAGFSGITVPALRIVGRRIQGSREIGRELDRLVPEPPLYPSDPDARVAVEQAERWGDESLQPAARRILWNALRRDRSPLRSYSEGAKLGIPIGLAVKTAAPIVALSARLNDATDENVRSDLAALPGMLQRIDDWIASGVLAGAELNAADLQIGASVRLLMTLQDLRPAIASRPAGELALRAAPDYPGDAPPVLPGAWLEGLREESPSPGPAPTAS